MKSTSIATYHENKQYHGTQKEQIVQALSFMGTACMHTIGRYMDKELHKISGRFGELEKAGLIRSKFVSKDHITFWELTQEGRESLNRKTETKKRRP